MTDSNTVFNGFAPLRNVVNLITLVERVKGRALNLPGMAVFYGPSGWGKSTAVLVAANTFDAYQVQIKSTWTKKHFCSVILKTMGIPEMRTVADMVNQIGEELSKGGKPLLIDEADHLVARGMVELVRDIYESSECAVIMIGEEELPRKLMQWERVHGRMLDWVAAEPAVIADVTHLIPHYCRGLELDEPLKDTRAISMIESRLKPRRTKVLMASSCHQAGARLCQRPESCA